MSPSRQPVCECVRARACVQWFEDEAHYWRLIAKCRERGSYNYSLYFTATFMCTRLINKRWRRGYLRKVVELWEDIHVTETVYGDDRAVSGSLLDMQKRVPELFTIGMQEIY